MKTTASKPGAKPAIEIQRLAEIHVHPEMTHNPLDIAHLEAATGLRAVRSAKGIQMVRIIPGKAPSGRPVLEPRRPSMLGRIVRAIRYRAHGYPWRMAFYKARESWI